VLGTRPGPPILTAEIRAHCEMIHTLAAPLAGQGKLVIGCFGEDPGRPNPKTGAIGCPLAPRVVHVEIGAIESTARTVTDLTVGKHRNVYASLAVFRSDLVPGKKGFEKDIIAVLGLVADFDDTDSARWEERLPLPPNLVLETSTGRFQAFYFFDKPEAFAAAKPVAARLKTCARCDDGTADLSHVWRIAGTLNWPNAKKVGAGRPREPQTVRVVRPWQGDGISLADLAAALPEPKAEPSISVGSGEKVEAEPPLKANRASPAARMSRSSSFSSFCRRSSVPGSRTLPAIAARPCSKSYAR
jgi:RepB DNA-primase from phage plasmid